MKCGSVRKVIANDPLRDDSHSADGSSCLAADDAMTGKLADEQVIRYT